MAGNRSVVGGTYTGPRSEPGGQNTPRAGRSVAAIGGYKTDSGSFAQQIDQGLIWDDAANGFVTASAPVAVGGGVAWNENFEDGDLVGWNAPDVLSGVFTATNDAAVGHDGGRALHIISDSAGSGLRRWHDDAWTYTDTLFKFWMRVNAIAQNTAVIQARDGTGGTVWSFAYDVLTSHAEVAIFNESGFVTFLQLPNGSLGLNTWAYFELRMKAELVGQASLTQDNGTPVTYSGDLHRTNPMKEIQFWAEYGNQNSLVDDLVLVHEPDASASESFSASDTGSGTVTASGTASELNSFTGTGAGTVTASGSGVEGYAYTDSRTASATASGSSSENFSASDTNSGTTTASGTSSESSSFTDAAAATATASGSATESSSQTGSGTTTATTSGSASESFSATESGVGVTTASGIVGEQTIYSDAGAATVTSSGSGSENFGVSYNDSGTGTVTASGTASEGQSLTDSSAGTGALSGSGSENAQRSGSGNADLVAAGTGSDSSSHTGQGSGAGILSGTGVESYSSATGFQDSGSGSITAAGSGSDFQNYTDDAALTITVTGTGDDSYQVADVANANVTAEGAGTESSIRDSTADGIVTTAGSGVEFIGQPPERSDIIWGIQAGPRATASISTISSNSTLLSPPRPSPSIQEKQPVKVEVAT